MNAAESTQSLNYKLSRKLGAVQNGKVVHGRAADGISCWVGGELDAAVAEEGLGEKLYLQGLAPANRAQFSNEEGSGRGRWPPQIKPRLPNMNHRFIAANIAIEKLEVSIYC